MQIYKEHFIANLSPDVAKYIFKHSISGIELAISSYCNRRCTYCPNYIVDRTSTKQYMSDDVFVNIMDQLRSIEYSGYICVHRYNEPLADTNYALLRISSIRSFLPKANIQLYTNGDYLNKNLLQTLADIGVNAVIATTHPNNANIPFNELTTKHKQMVEKLDLPFTYNVEKDRCLAVLKVGGLSLHYHVVDWSAKNADGSMFAFDRGGSIDTNKKYERVEPCLTIFNNIQIEYDGTLLPCCNIHPDVEKHKKHILGKLDGDSNLFVEWTNDQYVKWRKMMVTFGNKGGPCANCEAFIVVKDTPESRLMCENVCKSFDIPTIGIKDAEEQL